MTGAAQSADGKLAPPQLTEILHQLSDLADRETMPRFRLGIGVDNKASGAFDPVTEADRAAETAIRQWLVDHFPEHGIVGEEAGSSNSDAEFVWHIDPVDGTRAFICGLPTWGTLIGLAHKGSVIAGVMAQPFTGERYLAGGDGAWLFRGGKSQRLKSRATGQLSSALMMTTSPYLFSDRDIPRYRELEKRCRMTRYGFDCYAYAMLASGHIDLVVESGLKSYDVAALIAIIEQAGGTITDWDGNNALPGGRILAAANATLHRQAMSVLRGES